MKIRLLKLYLKNYCGFFGYKEYDLKDLSGSISLIGDNGAGKSTFLNTFLFAFYGRGKYSTLKDLINTASLSSGDSPEVFVALDFCIDGDPTVITIRREITDSSMVTKLYFDGKLFSRKKSDVDNYISNLLKVNYDLVYNTIFSEQKRVANFFSISNSEKKEFFDSILSVGFDDLVKKNTYILNVTEKRKDKFSSVLRERQNNLSNIIIPQITSLENYINSVSVNTLMDDLKKYELEIENLRKEEVLLAEKISRLDGFDDYLNEFESKKKEIEKLNYRIEELRSLLNKYETDCLNDKNKLKETIKLFSEKKSLKIKKLTFDESRIKKGTDLIADLKKEISDLESQILDENILILEMSKEESYLNNIKDELYKLKNSDPDVCILCGSKLTEKHKEKIMGRVQDLEQEIDKKEKVIFTLKSNINEQSSKNKLLLEKIEERKVKCSHYESFLDKLHEEFKVYMSNKSDRKDLAKLLRLLRNNIYSLRNSIKSIELSKNETEKTLLDSINLLDNKNKELEKMSERVEDLIKEKNEIDKNREKLAAIQNSIESLSNKVKDIVSTISSINTSKKSLDDLLVTKGKVEKSLSKLDSLLERVKDKCYLVGQASEIISKSFGEYSVQAINSIFNIQNRILFEINSGLYIKPLITVSKKRIDYDFKFYRNNIEVPSSLISGGQETILGSSFRVALWKYISAIQNNPISFILLDEIFEGLSPINAGLVFNYVSNLKNLFRYIFITSHTEHILNTDHSIQF